jgi:hypothetical protein
MSKALSANPETPDRFRLIAPNSFAGMFSLCSM